MEGFFCLFSGWFCGLFGFFLLLLLPLGFLLVCFLGVSWRFVVVGFGLVWFLGYLEEKNSVTNQDMLYSESHQSDKVIDRNMSQQTQWQHFTLHTSTASSAKIHSADASVEQLTVGSIKKNETEEAIYLSNQENKPPKSPESVSCKDMSSKEDSCKVATKEGNSTCHKPASFELATKLNKDDSDLSNFVMLRDDSDLSNFIMLRSTHKLTPRQEKKHVDCSEKGMQSSLFCYFSWLNSAVLYQLQ